MSVSSQAYRGCLRLPLAILTLMTAACGGGGGGGPTLSIALSPQTLAATIREGYSESLYVGATVTGSVSGDVVVVFTDHGGSIEPSVELSQAGETSYSARFQTLTTLPPGVRSSRIDVKVCSSQSCSTVYGSATLPYTLTVVPNPRIASLSPTQATQGDPGFSLVVNGSSFSPNSVVQWGYSNRPTQFVSATQLRADISAADIQYPGNHNVLVLDGGLRSADAVFQVIPVPAPQLSAITPTSAPAGSDGLMLTVDGGNFRDNSRVLFNGELMPTTRVSATRLTAAVPETALRGAGPVAVSIRDIAIGYESSQLEFNRLVPILTTLNPQTATAGEPGFTLTVEGSQFVSRSVVLWNGDPRTTSVVSPTRLTAQISAADISHAGSPKISVRNGDESAVSSDELTMAVSHPAPALGRLSPASAVIGDPSFTLTVTGTRFFDTSTVLWNGSPRPTTYVSATRLTAEIAASDLSSGGPVPVTVSNPAPGGGSSEAVSFTVNHPLPVIQLINANSATAGCGDFLITVVGSNIGSYSTVLWNDQPRSTTQISPTVLQARVPAADISTAGTATVRISNPTPGGGNSATRTFTIRETGSPTTEATAFQLDPAHTGVGTSRCPVSLPTQSSWTYTQANEVSYPLIAEGKVFVFSSRQNSNKQLSALDQSTGAPVWGPITVLGQGPAYDGGSIFLVGSDSCCSFGLMQAVDAASGAIRFRTDLRGYVFSSGVSARNGIAYTGEGGGANALYAVDGASGTLLWSVSGGDFSNPAVTDSGVYITPACATYAYDPVSGTEQWSDYAGCSGGGGATPVAANGVLYAPNGVGQYDGSTFRTSDGSLLGSYSADYPPAVAAQVGYFPDGGYLHAIRLSDQSTLWTFGDGYIYSSPIVVNEVVFTAQGRTLYALDAPTGTLLWSQSLAMSIAEGASWGQSTAPALAAGAGWLIVPTGNSVTAFNIGQ